MEPGESSVAVLAALEGKAAGPRRPGAIMADTLVRTHFIQLLPSFQCEVDKGTLAVVPDSGRLDILNRVL